MSNSLADFEKVLDEADAIALRGRDDRRSAEEQFVELIENTTAELDEKWRFLFESPGIEAIPDDPDAEIVGGFDRLASELIRLSDLQVRCCEKHESQFASPRLTRCKQRAQSINQQMRRYWPFRNEARIAESRAYFESGGKGISAKELLDELRG